jgi:glycine cleavage system transcriptional repressor
MPEQLVITALGGDRPGIVSELSDVLHYHGLNIEDSRMSALGGEFAILLLVSGEKKSIDSFVSNTADLEETLQMKLLIKLTQPMQQQTGVVPYHVEVVSIDHPGIVHKLASFFSSRRINIVDLETERYAAPHTGSPMFALNMTIGIPSQQSISKLREDFLEMCDELNLDARITAST